MLNVLLIFAAVGVIRAHVILCRYLIAATHYQPRRVV